jgi:enamine deaminase RidA (YjgF/YER057c/UK114 family)
MADRQRAFTGTKWEKAYGYCRALRVGDVVYVSGTTGTNEAGELVGVGDPRAQTEQIFRKIEGALAELGASLQDIVRTRMFVVGAENSLPVAEVHGAILRDVQPVSTLVMVAGLIEPQMLVEIEVEAVVEN